MSFLGKARKAGARGAKKARKAADKVKKKL
jgi:hypothetical protein